MDEENPVITKMDDLLQAWEVAQDRRMIFLQCYQMMTQNILAAIGAGYFEDNAWVGTLMDTFAGYYFRALEAFETQPVHVSAPWRIAFTATSHPRTHVLQNLVLGINAHISYDLVFALIDVLEPEWQQLSHEARQMRYRDHCRVNDVIYKTIDAVQDQVVDRYEPIFGVVDTVLGPVDEWMTSLFISRWREEVWEHVNQFFETSEGDRRSAVTQRVEAVAIDRAREILGHGNLTDLIEMI